MHLILILWDSFGVKEQFHTLKFGKSLYRIYLMLFSTTYLCEQGFSALLLIKNKPRNRLKVSHDIIYDMRVALSKNITPRIQEIVQKMQAQKLFDAN